MLPLRKALGASQLEMAELLGTTRTSYALYESGQRELPAKARRRFVELQLRHHANQATRKSEGFRQQDVDPGVIARWQRLVRRYVHYLRNMEILLRETEARFAEAIKGLAGLEDLSSKSAAEQRWQGRVRRRHQEVLRMNGPEVQMEFRMRIANYKARIAMLEEQLSIAGAHSSSSLKMEKG
jgi:transcriptional regulator with XRE-family HTH domain